jgi:16S rRNA (cytidine1402-2'-O)-methyltransferase
MTDQLTGKVFLIPSVLHDQALHTIPAYIKDAVKECNRFFVENERSARRFLKSIWKEMVIDDYGWTTIHKAEQSVVVEFEKNIRSGSAVGIISEAGCPGIADPGQILISIAHKHGARVVPLVGPSSILLALMASGLNGQMFQFNGYLPIETSEKIKALRQIESDSFKKKCTQIFIETPYRNNQLLETILKVCQSSTFLCIACDLTSPNEWIRTRKIIEWNKNLPDLHKRPVVFLLNRET